MHQPRWLIWTMLALGLTGCRAPREIEAPVEARRSFQTIEYCQFGDRFVGMIVNQDFESAYELCSTSIRERQSLEQFRQARLAERDDFGRIKSARPISDCQTDTNILRGPRNLKSRGDPIVDNQARLEAIRMIADTPDSIPFSIRRAAVKAELLMDPHTVPDYVGRVSSHDDDVELEIPLHIHLVIVEDNGHLAVAHFWRQWPEIAQ